MNRELFLSEWWDSWRAQDFSWEGLSEKFVEGLWIDDTTGEIHNQFQHPDWRDASLQDIWREEEGRLVDGPDGRYAEVHLPLKWADGSDTGRANWRASHVRDLASRIRAKITSLAERFPEIFDGSWQAASPLDGAILPRSMRLIDGFVREGQISHGIYANWMYIDSNVRMVRIEALGPIEFRNCVFSELVSLSGSTFAGDFNIANNLFLRRVRMIRPIFQSEFNISGSLLFDHFSSAGATHQKVARFAGVSAFSDFSITTANFQAALELDGLIASSKFSLTGCTADSGLSALNAIFDDICDFSKCTFKHDVDFSHSAFNKSCTFDKSVFDGISNYTGVSFSGSMLFRYCRFTYYAIFRSCAFPSDALLYVRCFRDSQFCGGADFSGKDFCAYSIFDEVDFKRPPLLSDHQDMGRSTLAASLAQTEDAAVRLWGSARLGAQNWSRDEAEEFVYSALEGGMRVLKLGMEAKRSRSQEQAFYRGELAAKRRRPSTSRRDKLVNFLYEQVSDYGSDTFRPLLWLALVGAVFVSVYYYGANRFGEDLHVRSGSSEEIATLEALEISLRSTIKPFSAWDTTSKSDIAWLRRQDKGLRHTAFLLSSSIQSFISVLLIFLSVLAIKRKFQIS